MIDFTCLKCGEPVSVPSSLAGEMEDCPNCNTPLRVPQEQCPTPQPPPQVAVATAQRAPSPPVPVRQSTAVAPPPLPNAQAPNCTLIIMRERRFVGCLVSFQVAVDGCMAGPIRNGMRLGAIVSPGKHKVSFVTMGVPIAGEVDVPAGGIWFVRLITSGKVLRALESRPGNAQDMAGMDASRIVTIVGQSGPGVLPSCKGGVTLLVGILGLLVGLLGLVAFAGGMGKLQSIRNKQMSSEGVGMVYAGMVIGLIGFVGNVIGLIIHFAGR